MPADSTRIIAEQSVDCGALFTLKNQKFDYLGKRPYIYSAPYYEMIFNSKRNYGVFQLGRGSGRRPFLYIKLFPFNTCIKNDEVVEFLLVNGSRYRLKNIYDANCDGVSISELKPKDVKTLTKEEISSVKVLTFEKDYEFRLSHEDAERMQAELRCIIKRFKYR